jgi:phospholipase/carboxylesterase
MATHLMRHAPERFTSYVNLAGFVVPGEAPADARLSELRPPVFWGRGAVDPVIPQAAIDLTDQWLAPRSSLTTRVYPGLGHSISAAEVDDVSGFLRETLLG